MSSTSASLCCLTVLMLFTLSWLCICSIAPYWKTIQAPEKINFGASVTLFPGMQKILNLATGLLSSVSIDIGVVYTCFNFNERSCSRNNQIQNYLPFVKLPEEQHILMFGLALSLLCVAFISLLLLIYCPNSCLFCLSMLLSFSSLCMLVIAIIGMSFTIEAFNNWASVGFIIGTFFVFILFFYHCTIWINYRKDRRLRTGSHPGIAHSFIPMMA